MGKKEKADVITIEERMDFSVNRRISHKKKILTQYYKEERQNTGSNSDKLAYLL